MAARERSLWLRSGVAVPVGLALAVRMRAAYALRESVETTMVYTHVLARGGRGVTSPLDRM